MAIYTVRQNMTNATEADMFHYQMSFIQQGVTGDGNNGDDFLVEAQSTPDMTVKVNKGRAWIENSGWTIGGTDAKFIPVEMTADTNLNVSSNSSGSTRYDVVILKYDTSVTADANASNVVSVIIVEGSAGSGVPSDSYIQSYIGSNNGFLKLAYIKVSNGASSVTHNDMSVGSCRTGFLKTTQDAAHFARKNFLMATSLFLDGMDETNGWLYASDYSDLSLNANTHEITYTSQGNETFYWKELELSYEPLLSEGDYLCYSGWIKKNNSGDKRVQLDVAYYNGSWHYDQLLDVNLWVEGDTTQEWRFGYGVFQIPIGATKLRFRVTVDTGSTDTQIITKHLKVEKGFIPTAWKEREWAVKHAADEMKLYELANWTSVTFYSSNWYNASKVTKYDIWSDVHPYIFRAGIHGHIDYSTVHQIDLLLRGDNADTGSIYLNEYYYKMVRWGAVGSTSETRPETNTGQVSNIGIQDGYVREIRYTYGAADENVARHLYLKEYTYFI